MINIQYYCSECDKNVFYARTFTNIHDVTVDITYIVHVSQKSLEVINSRGVYTFPAINGNINFIYLKWNDQIGHQWFLFPLDC